MPDSDASSVAWSTQHGGAYRSDDEERTNPTPKPDAPAVEREPLLWDGDDS
jgi:hypothetical protein